MKKYQKGFSTIVLIIIGVIVLGGAGAFVMMGDRSSDTSTGSSEEAMTVADEKDLTGESTGTITNLMASGQNLQCDWEMPGETEDNPFGTGKLWTSGNKGRSQITGNAAGVGMEGNAIYINNDVYTWFETAGFKQGFKFDQEELQEEAESMTAEERQQAEQISRDMKFNCQPWTVDESKFELPSDVNFDEV